MNTNMKPARYSIAGADIDLDMLRVLTEGDTVLAEINGARIFSTSENPQLADEHPWEVVEHVHGDYLVLSNSLSSRDLRLEYSDIITSGERQPAVFKLTGRAGWNNEHAPEIYIILQFVACRMDDMGVASLTRSEFVPAKFIEFCEDQPTFMGLMEEWSNKFNDFSKQGWRLRSNTRFAMRAGIPPALVRAFQEGPPDWHVILAQLETTAGMDRLMRMARELHSLGALIKMGEFGEARTAYIAPISQTGTRYESGQPLLNF